MKIEALQKFMLSLDPQERRNFARKCGTSHGQIKQIYCGNRKCNPALAIEIEKNSKGKVKCDELRPDTDFAFLRT